MAPQDDLSDPTDFDEDEAEQEVWTVTRGVGGTTRRNTRAGVLVMSTPLPIFWTVCRHPMAISRRAFVQAQMCIADQDTMK